MVATPTLIARWATIEARVGRTMLHVLMLDLQSDAALIAQYEAHHRSVWPEVEAHLARQGVLSMTIHRLGTRMVMLMQTDDARYDAERMERASQTDPVLVQWETLMWTFQAPTPWTPAGRKWTPLQGIFDWRAPVQTITADAHRR